MKSGRYFQIPTKPAELWTLWNRGRPIDRDRLPDWLTWEEAAAYRRFGSASSAGLTAEELRHFAAEIDELELCRLIVDRDAADSHLWHVYVGLPQVEPVWSIGIYRGPSPLQLEPAPVDQPVLSAEHVTDAVAAFVADPFWIRRGSEWFMFFEVMNWKANKGEVGLAVSDDGLHWRYCRIVLAEDFHLSYPHVFQDGNDIFLVPESHQDNSVRLYRAKRFPDEWEYCGPILEGGYFADSTPLWHDGAWWLFTETGRDDNDRLRLFFAAALQGAWREHPRSPIVMRDAGLSRPAGPLTRHQGRLFRFAQDCTSQYGEAVRAAEVVQLDRSEYTERAIPGMVLAPSGCGWNAGGMHHVAPMLRDTGDWLAAVDGWRLPSIDGA